MQKPNYTAMAFLAMAFAVVGLTGLFATFGAPLPLERALARDAALDEAQVAAHQPDAAAALAALRPRLGDSAAPILDPVPDPSPSIDARIQAERQAMRARLLAEAGATAVRLRWMIVIITIMGAIFGAVVLRISGNARE